MIFVFHLLDRPGATELRMKVRPEHKAYLAAVSERIAFAGPLTDEKGQGMVGSLLAIDFDSREAASDWIRNEPYTKAGVYACSSIHAFQNLWPQRTGFPLQ